MTILLQIYCSEVCGWNNF